MGGRQGRAPALHPRSGVSRLSAAPTPPCPRLPGLPSPCHTYSLSLACLSRSRSPPRTLVPSPCSTVAGVPPSRLFTVYSPWSSRSLGATPGLSQRPCGFTVAEEMGCFALWQTSEPRPQSWPCSDPCGNLPAPLPPVLLGLGSVLLSSGPGGCPQTDEVASHPQRGPAQGWRGRDSAVRAEQGGVAGPWRACLSA